MRRARQKCGLSGCTEDCVQQLYYGPTEGLIWDSCPRFGGGYLLECSFLRRIVVMALGNLNPQRPGAQATA